MTDSAITDAAVAIGIVGEVLFGMRNNRIQTELRLRSNEKLERASERATRAEQELIHLKIPRRSLLSGEDPALSAALLAFNGTIFDVGMGPNDGEVEDCIWDIEPALWAAAWVQIDWVYPGGSLGEIRRFGGVNLPARFAMGGAAASNILITFHAGCSPQLHAAANALAAALNQLGIEAHVVEFNVHNMNSNAMHILIGPKR